MADYPYPQYKHGAYGQINASGVKLANNGKTPQAFVIFGTAPVGQIIDGGTKAVNKPILCNSMSDFEKQLGYSDDWDKYTLCEAAHVFLALKGIGPCVFVNVLNPTTHKASTASTASLTPANGKVTIATASNIAIDTIVVKKGSGQQEQTLVKDTDYTVEYDHNKNVVILTEITAGGFGTAALSITYYNMDATTVSASDVIGSTDGYGLNTGLYVVKNVYNLTGLIPAYICAPGWSSITSVNGALATVSKEINSHWNAFVFSDLPLMNSSTPLTVQTAASYKSSNGFNKDNQKVCYPMITGTDSNKYHMSVWFAANFAERLIANNGIPYMTASNTECGIIQDLYFGTDSSFKDRVWTDDVINKTLCANGISSAIYMSGKWVLWGSSAASYDQDNATNINVFDTALMMLYYITNDFQHRRNVNVDKPMGVNELKAIVAEEQSRIDALLAVNALTYGQVKLNVSPEAKSDMAGGDFRIIFDVTNVPLGKSFTAEAAWSEEGFKVYTKSLEEAA